MNPAVQAARPIRASRGTVLRVAQTIRLADALDSASLPGPLRRVAGRVLGSRLDRGLFAILLALGCSVTDSEPMRGLTLSRPLTRGRGPQWARGRSDPALLIRLQVREHADGTEVRVTVGTTDRWHVRGMAARVALQAGAPVLRWCLSAWLASLEDRIGAPGASRAGPSRTRR